MSRRHRRAWLLWGAAFVAIEAHAILTDTEHGTLSENIWATCGVRGEVPFKKTRRVALASFMVWLGVHITTGKLSAPIRRRQKLTD